MAISEAVLAVLDVKFAAVLPHLDERQRRLYLASEADALGHGGIAVVARVAEVSESTMATVIDCYPHRLVGRGPHAHRTGHRHTQGHHRDPTQPHRRHPPPDGSVHTSKNHATLCTDLDMTHPMGAASTSTDNSLAESFNATPKREALQDQNR